MKKLRALALLPVLAITGCTGQSTAVQLLEVANTSVDTLLTAKGIAIPENLNSDFATAESDVSNWKTGTPTQEVVEALNLVVSDLNVIPISDTDKAYIVLAIDTTEQVIQIFNPTTAPTANARVAVASVASKTKDPAGAYKARWNALATSGSTQTKVILK